MPNIDSTFFFFFYRKLTIPWIVHEVGEHKFPVAAIGVTGKQRVLAVVDVCGVVELQATVILVLGVIMNPGADEGPLSQRLTP